MEGPRQIQAILVRMQARMEEQRLHASLQAERDSPVDVQVYSPHPVTRRVISGSSAAACYYEAVENTLKHIRLIYSLMYVLWIIKGEACAGWGIPV